MKRLLAGLMLSLCAGVLPAAPEVPDAGLKAEMAGQWQSALTVYRSILAQQPQRVDLWLRMADIYHRLERPDEALEALEQAAELAPDNASLAYRLSRAYAMADRPRDALRQCQHAVELAPANVDYLHACLQQANWARDRAAAKASIQSLLELAPGDQEALRGRALWHQWTGEYPEAATAYDEYLRHFPNDQDAVVARVQVLSWAGDQEGAAEALAGYRSRFGDTDEYQRAKAQLLLQRGWFYAASDLLTPLAERHPEDYDIHFSRVLATRASGQPSEALESLAVMERLKPEEAATLEVGRVTRAPLRSLVGITGDHQFDEDDIRITTGTVFGELALSPETRVLLGYSSRRVSTREDSIFEADDGDRNTMDYVGWVGVRHQLHRRLQVEARVGRGNIEGGGDYGYYRLEAKGYPHDDLLLQLTRERALYALSPLSVSREIVETESRLRAVWHPNPLYQVEAWVSASDFSDDNSRLEFYLAPSRNVYQSGPWGVNLGLSAQRFTFDKDLDNGYYDPDYFNRFAGTALFYWSPNVDNWVGLRTSLGWHKDDTFSSYEFGSDVELEALIGRYRDWQFHGRIAYADRLQETGRYYGTSLHLGLIRRF
ncbi:tetratricopeptide repeat protein [Marinobacter sediminum]|uniref:tetratricopeptide repeat protein n=1 Tax=Marinobacter sediminum TaxID=256323 RepID=UPI002030F1B9|nr:tetratricopeptide repeat protein [Marinobacter sediminum]MCM0613814.1 tetratricopeptide repeat protein [Marinobacter sediminum]